MRLLIRFAILNNSIFIMTSLSIFQKITSTVFLRQLTDASTDLRRILTEKIPQEQERVKAFRKNHGATKVGEVTVDMVCILLLSLTNTFFYLRALKRSSIKNRIAQSYFNLIFILFLLNFGLVK